MPPRTWLSSGFLHSGFLHSSATPSRLKACERAGVVGLKYKIYWEAVATNLMFLIENLRLLQQNLMDFREGLLLLV